MQTAHIIRITKAPCTVVPHHVLTIRDAGHDFMVGVTTNYRLGITDPVEMKPGAIVWNGRLVPVGLYVAIK